MSAEDTSISLTRSLEDYLETVYTLVGERQVARVRDIASARGVKPGSVTPAMQRLAGMGLVDYSRREFIGLTPLGRTIAERIYERHQLLGRLLVDVLQLPADQAMPVACAMEHCLTPPVTERLHQVLDFFESQPAGRDFVTGFQSWLAERR